MRLSSWELKATKLGSCDMTGLECRHVLMRNKRGMTVNFEPGKGA